MEMAEFKVGNRSKSFPFKREMPMFMSSSRKLDTKSLEKELLSRFKSRRLHPHYHVQMGINKSPRQRLEKSFYPSSRQPVQSIDRVYHNDVTLPSITCAADDRLGADVIDTFDVPSHKKHDRGHNDKHRHSLPYLKPQSQFNGYSSQGVNFEKQFTSPRLRNSDDASDSRFYTMNKKPRGIAIIINNYEFYKEMIAITNSGPQTLRVIQKGLRRDGSIEDTDKLGSFFRNELHFIVKGYANVPARDMVKILSDVSDDDHAQFDAFVCCIASHGRKGTVFGSDCREIKVHEITGLFTGSRCVSLSGKPKCFFIQGCCGDHFNIKDVLNGPRNIPREHSYIPLTCDFLIAYSMVRNCTEYPARQSESLLYKTLLRYIRKYSHRYDLTSIMVRVKKALAKLQESTIGVDSVFQCNFRAQLSF
ncbi:caspase-3 isoform X2 [Magallana gigas]|uniref:caspase-3 isoform X2 n=1 Tax=Magallana gigas TaxID=29159 RepID=UPI003342AA3D